MSASLLFVNARLWSGAPLAADALLVREGRIAAIGPRSEVTVPADAKSLDFPTAHVYPGLVDALTDAYVDNLTRGDGSERPENVTSRPARFARHLPLKRGRSLERRDRGAEGPAPSLIRKLENSFLSPSLLLSGRREGLGREVPGK